MLYIPRLRRAVSEYFHQPSSRESLQMLHIFEVCIYFFIVASGCGSYLLQLEVTWVEGRGDLLGSFVRVCECWCLKGLFVCMFVCLGVFGGPQVVGYCVQVFHLTSSEGPSKVWEG